MPPAVIHARASALKYSKTVAVVARVGRDRVRGIDALKNDANYATCFQETKPQTGTRGYQRCVLGVHCLDGLAEEDDNPSMDWRI